MPVVFTIKSNNKYVNMDKLNRLQECAIKPTKPGAELNGDNSQDWDDFNNVKRNSAIKGVEFKLTNPDLEARRATQCLDEIK
jgi:hypothetical protein